MYLKQLILENLGPLSTINYTMPFDDNGSPKPLILVGQNGSGKSILLSQIINALLSAYQSIFDNSEVEKGKVYKYRSPDYISIGSQYYFAQIEFEGQLFAEEWQLSSAKKDFETKFGYKPARDGWLRFPEDENSYFWTNFSEKRNDLLRLVNSNCILYFPANRFEDPGWLNYANLVSRAEYMDLIHVNGHCNRSIIQYSPMSKNRDWIYDVIFDRQAFERRTQNLSVKVPQGLIPIQQDLGFSGHSTDIYNAVIEILRIIIGDNKCRFGVDDRKNRKLSIMRDNDQLIPNIFQLSTGQTSLLNIFLSIIRDYDLSGAVFSGLQNITGIVVIDEIDTHLHSNLQSEILPALIKLFSKVQFIITSHSPLFLLGMQRELSDDGFELISLPDGSKIGVERFSEFQKAYDTFKCSQTFEQDLVSALQEAQKPIVFVEGDYDIRYLRRAAELLGRQNELDSVELQDAGGFGGLEKIWKNFDSKLSSVSPRRIILLYDCDTKKVDGDRDVVAKRVIPFNIENPIAIGIENLLSQGTIDKIRVEKPNYFDFTPAYTKKIRGQSTNIPEKLEVNKDEKGNLCQWICTNGVTDDFQGFEMVIDLISALL